MLPAKTALQIVAQREDSRLGEPLKNALAAISEVIEQVAWAEGCAADFALPSVELLLIVERRLAEAGYTVKTNLQTKRVFVRWGGMGNESVGKGPLVVSDADMRADGFDPDSIKAHVGKNIVICNTPEEFEAQRLAQRTPDAAGNLPEPLLLVMPKGGAE